MSSTSPSRAGLALHGADLHDETQRWLAVVEAMTAGEKGPHEIPVELARRPVEEGGLRGPVVVVPEGADRAVRALGHDVPVRVLVPPGPLVGAYLHLHGGGWTMGGQEQQDPHLWRFATEAGMAVVSVGYRLAPEHPHPAAADDCEAAAVWLATAGRAELGVERLAIGGESAGAHLSALTLLRLRDRHPGLLPAYVGANLVYGCYDLGLTPSCRSWGARTMVLSTPIVTWHTEQLAPGRDAERRRDPGLSPLYADLRGLPEALLTVGTEDPVLDDSLFLHARWTAAGSPARLQVWDGGIHAFNLFPLGIGERSNQEQVAFLRAVLERRKTPPAV